MKILLIGWETPPLFTYGGQGVFLENLAQTLSSKHEVIITGCSPNHEIGTTIKKDYTSMVVCRVTDLLEPNIRSINNEAITWITPIAKTSDIIIINDFHLAHAGYLLNPAQTIFYTHAFYPHPTTIPLYLKTRNAVNSKLTKETVLSYQQTIMNLVSFAEEDNDGYNPPVVVYPALPKSITYVMEKQPNPTPPKPFALALIRNQWNKGADVFIKAIIEYNKKNPDKPLHGVIAGRGWETKQEQYITILGNVSEAEKQWLLKNMIIGVLPSIYEPFGLVTLEYLAHDKPVITSNQTGVNELLGKTAITYNPTNHKELAQKIQEIMQHYENNTINNIIQQQKIAGLSRTWNDVAKELLSLVE